MEEQSGTSKGFIGPKREDFEAVPPLSSEGPSRFQFGRKEAVSFAEPCIVAPQSGQPSLSTASHKPGMTTGTFFSAPPRPFTSTSSNISPPSLAEQAPGNGTSGAERRRISGLLSGGADGIVTSNAIIEAGMGGRRSFLSGRGSREVTSGVTSMSAPGGKDSDFLGNTREVGPGLVTSEGLLTNRCWVSDYGEVIGPAGLTSASSSTAPAGKSGLSDKRASDAGIIAKSSPPNFESAQPPPLSNAKTFADIGPFTQGVACKVVESILSDRRYDVLQVSSWIDDIGRQILNNLLEALEQARCFVLRKMKKELEDVSNQTPTASNASSNDGCGAFRNEDSYHPATAAPHQAQQMIPVFKFVVQVTVMQRSNSGLHLDAACLWDTSTDGSITVTWENDSMHCVVSIYGLVAG